MGNRNSNNHTGDTQFDSWYPWGRYKHDGKHVKEISVYELAGIWGTCETDWHITYTDNSKQSGTYHTDSFFPTFGWPWGKKVWEKAEKDWGFVRVTRKNSGDGNTYCYSSFKLVPKEKQQFDMVSWRKSQL